MRLLIISNCYPPRFIGGAELIAHRQAKRLQQLGHVIHVFAGDHSGSRPRHECNDELHEGIPVTRIQVTELDTSLRYTNYLNPTIDSRCRAVIERFKPDVVHFHNTIGLSLGPMLYCHERRIPVVVTFHDHWGFCMRNTLITTRMTLCNDFEACARCQPDFEDHEGRRIPISARKEHLQAAFAGVSRFITPSAYLASQYISAGFDRFKFEILSYGVDPAVAMPRRTQGPVRFATLCYLGEHKGVHVILDAFRKLPPGLEWHFDIIGFGHLEARIRDYLVKYGLSERVTMRGRLPNDQALASLSRTDVTILASIWPENEPVSILESLAHGVPVIATAVGGVPELIQHDHNGWLVPPGDSDALSHALYDAVINPARRHRLALAALLTGTRWPELRQAARLERIYQEVVGSISAPGRQRRLMKD